MFWTRTPKKPPRIPLTEQLRALAECGIAPRSADVVAMLIEEWGQESLERCPYDLILTALGSDGGGESPTGTCCGIGVWHVDSECISDVNDYVAILRALCELARNDIQLDNIRAGSNVTPWVEVTCAGREVHWDLKACDDWIDPTLLTSFAHLLAESGSRRRLLAEQSETQDFLLICPTMAQWKKLRRLSPVRFDFLGPRW